MKLLNVEMSEITDNIITLANTIKKHNITKIVAIARGGLIPARYISTYLGVSEIYTIGIRNYDGKVRLDEPEMYEPLRGSFNENDVVLIIDELTDSGGSFKLAIENVKIHKPKKIITCSIHYKENTVFKPDYYVREIDKDIWINYPWE